MLGAAITVLLAVAATGWVLLCTPAGVLLALLISH